MSLRNLLLGLTFTGLAFTSACVAETTIENRAGDRVAGAGLDFPDDGGSCGWICITCADPDVCTSECFPTDSCPETEGCGFVISCHGDYAWSEEECDCVLTEGPGNGHGKGDGHGNGNDDEPVCDYLGICEAGFHWDNAVCTCLPNTPAGPAVQ
jgi:hypothetical protein